MTLQGPRGIRPAVSLLYTATAGVFTPCGYCWCLYSIRLILASLLAQTLLPAARGRGFRILEPCCVRQESDLLSCLCTPCSGTSRSSFLGKTSAGSSHAHRPVSTTQRRNDAGKQPSKAVDMHQPTENFSDVGNEAPAVLDGNARHGTPKVILRGFRSARLSVANTRHAHARAMSVCATQKRDQGFRRPGKRTSRKVEHLLKDLELGTEQVGEHHLVTEGGASS